MSISHETMEEKIEAETTHEQIYASTRSTEGMSGPQKFAVICARYSDVPNTRWTRDEIEDIMEILDDFWYNASYANSLGSLGTITIDAQVEGWYTLPDTQNQYTPLWDTDPNTENHWDDLVDDAIALADGDFNFANFDYILVWINDNWRGVSTIGKGYQINTAEGTFNVAASLVGENVGSPESSVWGRVAHEMGHSFELGHTHQNYNSFFALMARAYPADLNVYSQSVSATNWFDKNKNQEEFYPGDVEQEFVLRPRSVDISGDIQSLKVVITYFNFFGIKIPTSYYLVEVIQQWSEDAWVSDEGVLIYRVDLFSGNEPCTDMDANPATLTLQDCLFDAEEIYTDSANSIIIEVGETFGVDGYKIKVNNKADPIDLMIRPWGSEGSIRRWETADIWVDSYINGWDFYRYRDSSGNPIGVGDDPWAKHENRLYARIHNIGGSTVTNAIVKFYAFLPSGIGGSWDFIDQTTVTLSPGTSKPIYVNWTPDHIPCTCRPGLTEVHGCVKVVIEPITGELETGNNQAQENIDYYEITQDGLGTSWGSFCMCLIVVNPTLIVRDLYINTIDMTRFWNLDPEDPEYNISGRFHTFQIDELRKLTMNLNIDPETPFGTTLQADIIMSLEEETISIDPNFIGDIHLEPYGGISVEARTLYRSRINLSATEVTEGIQIKGNLHSIDNMPQDYFPKEDRKILLELELNETMAYEIVITDNNGDFELIYETTGPLDYTVKAYYAGSEYLASTKTETVSVSTSAGTIGFNYIFSVVTFVFLAVIISRRRRDEPKTK